MDRIFREAITIELHPDNMNGEDGSSLSRAWKPFIRDLKEWRQFHAEEFILLHSVTSFTLENEVICF
jgi:hypothetical protein